MATQLPISLHTYLCLPFRFHKCVFVLMSSKERKVAYNSCKNIVKMVQSDMIREMFEWFFGLISKEVSRLPRKSY